MNDIVGLDIDSQQRVFQDNFRFVHGDAASMEYFQDGEFDVVFCIGVLERVVPYHNLKSAASEIQRVGKAYAVVVPDVASLIDPHSQLPLGQFLPSNFNRFTRRWDLIDSGGRDQPRKVEGETLIYLRTRDWKSLFPGATVISYSHMAMGLLRDLIIYRNRSV